MFSFQNIWCNDSLNKPLLEFRSLDNGFIRFDDNTMYFIIGKSGIGKSTLLNFFTSPFSEDPIKNGIIHFDASSPVPMKKNVPIRDIKIENSAGNCAKPYFAYLRKNFAFIPQMTNSFHPHIPLIRQLESTYLAAYTERRSNKTLIDRLYNGYDSFFSKIRNSADRDEFRCMVSMLGKRAGFTKVEVAADMSKLEIYDRKEYEDAEGKKQPVIEIKKEVSFEGELSTGQLQRLLVLRALIQFKKASILFGDEFLVNFSFLEGNKVLNGILDSFQETDNSSPKTAAFIFHDLSYPCIKEIVQKRPELRAKVMLLEKIKKTPEGRRMIGIQTVSMKDFWSDSVPESFLNYRKSYLDKEWSHAAGNGGSSGGSYKTIFAKTKYEAYTYPGEQECVYEDFYFEFRENRFIILTGFSGCGKSTFCNRFVESYIPREEKWKFRYFPSTSHESLSFGSDITVEEDLQEIFKHYNGVKNIRAPETAEKIIKHFKNIQLFGDKDHYEEFLMKPLFSLSGGELQRYWFARITFLEGIPEKEKPRLLIFDESISSLDCLTKDNLLDIIIRRLFIEQQFTILFITHDLRDIGVIYTTLLDMQKAHLFEHYEMFDKRMFSINTLYMEYKENITHGKFNRYSETNNEAKIYRYSYKPEEH
jgi:ABC-type dipeptide/oligopeptide/nickel transport system ATPase subunit